MPLVTLATFVLLILLGILGIASWLRARQPNLSSQLGQLEAVGGWIGLVGLIWGIILLLRWLSAIQFFSYAPGFVLLALVVALVITALSLILALPQLRTLLGSNDFTTNLGRFAAKLEPYKLGLGFACLVLALYELLGMLRVL